MTRNRSLNENRNDFCVDGRILPSLFVIGIQKCGTSTLDVILSKFRELTHGEKKEHHFFDDDFGNFDLKKYLKQFPNCKKNVVRSYDATPKYTMPITNAAENIKRFYDKLGILLNQLIFIAIVCPNSSRVPSGFHSRREKGNQGDSRFLNLTKRKFNEWFDWILEHPDHDILPRGFYDQIFAKYFELFPESTFLLIDSQYAFAKMQNLGDFLAKELNFPERHIPNIHSNRGKVKKEELTEFNMERLNHFYSKHEEQFSTLIKFNKNVKTFPSNLTEFFDKWK